jgi:hypothetical protein
LSRFWAFDAEKIFNWSIPKEMLTFSTMETKADNHEVHEGTTQTVFDWLGATAIVTAIGDSSPSI